jgi:hypothetical protein
VSSDAQTAETPEEVLASLGEDPSAGTDATTEDESAEVTPAASAAAKAATAVAPNLPAEDVVPQASAEATLLPAESAAAPAAPAAAATAATPVIDPHPVPTASAKHDASPKSHHKGKATAARQRREEGLAAGSVGERVLRYVAKEDTKVFAAPQASANVLGRLGRGERVFVVIEADGWGRVAGERFVKLADLSASGVARQRVRAAWKTDGGEVTP